MWRSHTRARFSARLLLLLSLLVLPACFSESQWTFGLSRSVYAGNGAVNTSQWNSDGGENSGAAVILLFVPLLVDIVILPVAVPRDLWVLATEP